MLSPNLAEIGIGTIDVKPSWAANALEGLLGIADQIHLVHRHDHVTDAQQRTDQRVPARLNQHALARIDKNDG